MASFASSVNAPGASSYDAPGVNFGILGDLYKTYQQSQLSEQQKRENELIIAKRQQDMAQAEQLRQLFSGGLPMRNGQIDYQAVTQALAKAGDINAIPTMAPLIQQQSAGAVSPLLTGGTAPVPAAPARPPGDLPPISSASATRTSPQGDAGTGTIASIVAAKYGDASSTTGELMSRIARTMGVDPNANLTPGQQRRAEGLLTRYGPADGGGSGTAALAPAAAPPGGPQTAPASPNARVEEGFSTTAPALVPTPAPSASMPGSPAAPVPPSPIAAGEPPSGPPQGQPIIPPVPLPKGYSDPGQASQVLRVEAARLSANPYATGQVKALNDWAARIEAAQQPRDVSPGTRIVSPTGQTLYAAPERPVNVGGNLVRPDSGEVVYEGSSPLARQAIEDAARVYVETGKFPPNMGRGVQGERTRNAILERASGMENELGLDPKDRAARWQGFATHAAGLRALETRAANLTLVEEETKTLIPRVREASAKVSRTQYPSLNAIILAAQKGTGGQDVIKFGVAVESLIPVYARLLKPTGQIGVTDTQNARHILDKAWSDGQIGAALDQMEIERKAAKDALAEARKNFTTSTPGRGAGEKPTEAPAAKPIKWEKGGDGVLRPVQ